MGHSIFSDVFVPILLSTVSDGALYPPNPAIEIAAAIDELFLIKPLRLSFI
jgi:hypothetical protein